MYVVRAISIADNFSEKGDQHNGTEEKNDSFFKSVIVESFCDVCEITSLSLVIQGRHFYELHRQFEEMYTEVASNLDEIAERILMIGGKPLATMTKYLKEATLDEANADDKENEVIQQLL